MTDYSIWKKEQEENKIIKEDAKNFVKEIVNDAINEKI